MYDEFRHCFHINISSACTHLEFCFLSVISPCFNQIEGCTCICKSLLDGLLVSVAGWGNLVPSFYCRLGCVLSLPPLLSFPVRCIHALSNDIHRDFVSRQKHCKHLMFIHQVSFPSQHMGQFFSLDNGWLTGRTFTWILFSTLMVILFSSWVSQWCFFGVVANYDLFQRALIVCQLLHRSVCMLDPS